MKPAGIAIKKYAIKTEESTSVAWVVVNVKDLFKCGISIGSKLWAKPHKKNSEVINIKATKYDLFFSMLQSMFIAGKPLRVAVMFLNHLCPVPSHLPVLDR